MWKSFFDFRFFTTKIQTLFLATAYHNFEETNLREKLIFWRLNLNSNFQSGIFDEVGF